MKWWDSLKSRVAGSGRAIDDFLTPGAYAHTLNPEAARDAESLGMTPEQMATPGPAGEIGPYQMREIMFKDLQRLMPSYRKKDFYETAVNEVSARQAFLDYVHLLETHYAPHYKVDPTDENLLQMYNAGPTGFTQGIRNPQYLKNYNKYNRRP